MQCLILIGFIKYVQILLKIRLKCTEEMSLKVNIFELFYALNANKHPDVQTNNPRKEVHERVFDAVTDCIRHFVIFVHLISREQKQDVNLHLLHHY